MPVYKWKMYPYWNFIRESVGSTSLHIGLIAYWAGQSKRQIGTMTYVAMVESKLMD